MALDAAFLANQMFQDSPLSFDRQPPQMADGQMLCTGAITQPSGDILFRILAPGASRVRVELEIQNWCKTVELARGQGGVFEGTLPYNPDNTALLPCNVFLTTRCCFTPTFRYIGTPTAPATMWRCPSRRWTSR